MKARIVVLGGDGVGPEVTQAAQQCLEAVASRFGHSFEFSSELIGGFAEVTITQALSHTLRGELSGESAAGSTSA